MRIFALFPLRILGLLFPLMVCMPAQAQSDRAALDGYLEAMTRLDFKQGATFFAEPDCLQFKALLKPILEMANVPEMRETAQRTESPKPVLVKPKPKPVVVKAKPKPKPKPKTTRYLVKKGDTLSKIAKEHYGKSSKYHAIFNANKDILKDPDHIYPDQELKIPKLTD